MSLNAHCMVLFKNPRDASKFANLARQMYHKTWKFTVAAHKDATKKPYCYLLVDLRPEQYEDLRLRTNIFPGEKHYVYVSKWVFAGRSTYQCWNSNENTSEKWQWVYRLSECAKNVIKSNVPPPVIRRQTCVAERTTWEQCLPRISHCDRNGQFCKTVVSFQSSYYHSWEFSVVSCSRNAVCQNA